MEEIKGERNEFQSDGAEHHHQNGLDLGAFEVQIMRVLINKCFMAICRIVSPTRAGSTFSENHETKI